MSSFVESDKEQVRLCFVFALRRVLGFFWYFWIFLADYCSSSCRSLGACDKLKVAVRGIFWLNLGNIWVLLLYR